MTEDSGSQAGENSAETTKDERLYVPFPDGWSAHLKVGWEREMCHTQNPGEDFFHRLVAGELFLQRGDEKYCLNCAFRLGILSRERINWQRSSSVNP